MRAPERLAPTAAKRRLADTQNESAAADVERILGSVLVIRTWPSVLILRGPAPHGRGASAAGAVLRQPAAVRRWVRRTTSAAACSIAMVYGYLAGGELLDAAAAESVRV
jgi:hypothetical protein